MSALELKQGRCYRAKKPRNADGFFDDRQIIWIGGDQRQRIQYDGPSVKLGQSRPTVSRSDFLKWAERDVTDELPASEWKPWT